MNGTNSAPTITNPGDRNYRRGDRVQFTIPVVDPDEGDTVTVTVSGLPSGLVWQPDPGRVAGTVAMDAALQPYRVRVEATDGKASRSLTFTITIGDGTNGPRTNRAPDIVSPGNKSYQQGQTIPAFSIDATDPDEGDTATITSVSGLPEDLVWRSGSVSGTVAMDAAVRDYPVTVTATDGKDTASLTFTITITDATNGPGNPNQPRLNTPGIRTDLLADHSCFTATTTRITRAGLFTITNYTQLRTTFTNNCEYEVLFYFTTNSYSNPEYAWSGSIYNPPAGNAPTRPNWDREWARYDAIGVGSDLNAGRGLTVYWSTPNDVEPHRGWFCGVRRRDAIFDDDVSGRIDTSRGFETIIEQAHALNLCGTGPWPSP